ncbi:hypothetical protein [Janthinobacterium sp. RB2R34]|uniref:hypothetical protein n=1 Tax=Janthinobacterium sp. RB2R34 TaxID=3424193 RepID=UPI003F253711
MEKSLFETFVQLRELSTLNKRRSRVNKPLLIAAVVLGALAVFFSALYILILPAFVLLILSFVVSAVRKPKEQRVARRQMVLLKQATIEMLEVRGMSVERAKELTDNFPARCRELPFDQNLRDRFIALCHKEGMRSGGILIDERLL